jgi:serine/threonine protein kinase
VLARIVAAREAPVAVTTSWEFLEVLERSHLLSPEQMAELRDQPQGDRPRDPGDLARGLVARGILTRWQAQQLLAGQHFFFLGKYKLVERLGLGGMGVVFKAEHAPTHRTVAVKVMSKELLANPVAAARFQREVRILSTLNHPNIIAAYDADCVGGTHFLVMEYGEGQDLNRWVKQFGRLPIDWSCECIRQAADALQHAYEKGLVHRDIKPDNMLVEGDVLSGRPVLKLLDLGLARVVDAEGEEQTELTRSGQILGTPDYMAPEQAEDTRAADIRSDIFSLGCTLFKLLTGELPYSGNSPIEKLMARVTEVAAPVSRLRPECPRELDAVVARMLARQPGDRYQTPGEVSAALAEFATTPADPEAATIQLRMPEATPSQSFEMPLGADETMRDFFSQLGSQAAERTPTSSIGHRRPTKHRRLTKAELAVNIGALAALLLTVAFVWYWTRPGWLVLDWPVEERRGAKLDVDGEEVTLPDENPAHVQVDPGEHHVVVLRRGFEPITWDVSVGRARSVSLTPEWNSAGGSFSIPVQRPGQDDEASE